MEYAGQVETARSHRRAMKQAKEKGNTDSGVGQRKPNAGEFLRGFWKTDHLVPSVTVMIYFAPDVCQAIQKIRKEKRRLGEQDGERKGELKKAQEAAGKLHEMGLDTEKIA